LPSTLEPDDQERRLTFQKTLPHGTACAAPAGMNLGVNFHFAEMAFPHFLQGHSQAFLPYVAFRESQPQFKGGVVQRIMNYTTTGVKASGAYSRHESKDSIL